jgi:hypothetical protein
MNLRSTGILTIALAGALAAGGCTTMNGNQSVASALNTGSPSQPYILPLSETKATRLVYGGVPSTLPTGRQLTNRELSVTFKHHRTVFHTPNGDKNLMFGNRTVSYTRPDGKRMSGQWRVSNNLMCVKWQTMNENCYKIFVTGRNQYTVWMGDQPRGQMSVF